MNDYLETILLLGNKIVLEVKSQRPLQVGDAIDSGTRGRLYKIVSIENGTHSQSGKGVRLACVEVIDGTSFKSPVLISPSPN
jgi:hypothetical protein